MELASLSALMCAVLLVLARVLRLGFIANFLSRSVLIGFLTGVGIQVAMGQFGGMFGIPSQSGGTIQKFVETLKLIPTETSLATLAVSVVRADHDPRASTASTRRSRARSSPSSSRSPPSYFFDLAAHGVTVLGHGARRPADARAAHGGHDVDQRRRRCCPRSSRSSIVILAQSAATSRAYAMKYADSFDENVDLVGLGAANLGAALTGTFVVNGSPTKTEMVDSAGGRTQIAQLTAAAVVVVVLLFLTGAAGLHAQRGPGVGRVPDRHPARRLSRA